MRPRPEDRGERQHASQRLRFRERRFNAATARRPWRTCRSDLFDGNRWYQLSSSFNAATARRPWRTRVCRPLGSFNAATARIRTGASMRPRPKDRGERRLPDRDGVVVPGFNAATARRPWRTHGADRGSRNAISDGLQCGHGEDCRGEPQPMRRTALHSWASMRPRPKDRGEHPIVPHLLNANFRRSPEASMRGPRPERPWRTLAHELRWQGRGRRRSRCFTVRPRPKDRGERGCGPSAICREIEKMAVNAATASQRPWRTAMATEAAPRRTVGTELQCGHGPKTVENVHVDRSDDRRLHARGCFNAATAQRPWRTPGNASRTTITPLGRNAAARPEDRGEQSLSGRSAVLANQWSTAQCGHGPKTVENSRRLLETAKWPTCWEQWRSAASMRPRPEDRGEHHRPGEHQTADRSASMRPRPEDRGERLDSGCVRDGSAAASMRPRPEDRGELRLAAQATRS